MDFKENKSIYIQIAERICDDIILGKYTESERIPSVREYSAIVEVNVNTAMRSYDYLQTQDIIFNKRGIGFFVSPGAREKIISLRKKDFMEKEIFRFFQEIYTLDIDMQEINEMWEKFKKNKNQ